MEKMKLKIIDFEDKESQSGKKYVRFNTSEGWMSCFNSKAIETLKKECGNSVEVNIRESEDGNFRNIQGFIGKAESERSGKKYIKDYGNSPEKSSNNNKNTTMYVSYAKDIFCVLGERFRKDMNLNRPQDLMEQSINLVKQAKEVFE